FVAQLFDFKNLRLPRQGPRSFVAAHVWPGLVAEDAGGQVAIAAVADDRDDDGVLYGFRQLERRIHRAAGRHPAADAFFARERLHRALGVGLRDVDDLVDAFALENFRQVGFRPAADAGDARTVLRLQADDLDVGV